MANKMIKGITIEIGGNTTKLGQAIDASEKKTRSLQAELRQVERLLKFDPSNVELLTQKQDILTRSIHETEKKLQTLEDAQSQVNKQYERGEIGEEQLRAFQREIFKTKNDLDGMQKELVETNKAIEDIGNNDGIRRNSISVEEAKQNLKDLKESAKDSFETIKKGAVIAGTGIATGMGYAVKVSGEFDHALNTLATRTGATKAEMNGLDQSMQRVYKNNFGESIEDVAQSMATVKVNTKLVGQELEKATEYALLMRDTFDFDVNESTRTAKMLMDQFGISAKEAYNLIAQGAQNGLDKNGDLLDTINEYSVHYKQLGYTSEEFFNSLVNGTQNGTFSVDKLGDAVKEFGIRTKDTAQSTTEGFQLIGLNADAMRKKFAQGGDTAKKATEQTLKALFGLNDEVKRNQAGVALFGTMWEDLGEDAIKSLMNVNGSISTTSKALDNINEQKYDDIGNQLQELGRTIETDVAKPLGKELQPIVKEAINYVKENAPQIRDMISNIASAIAGMVGWIVDNSEIVLATIAGIGAGFIAWKSYTIISTIVTSLQAFKVAQEGATIAQLAFNTAMSANPIGLAVTAIAGLIGVLGVLALISKDEEDQHKKTMEAINEETQARQDNIDKQKEAIENATGEIENLRNLNTELKSLVDENGKVKSGNEARVQFILSQLNPALGTEMELVNGQITGYKDLAKNIDLMLLKKKAQVILEAQLPAYQEAVTKSTEAQIKANKLYNEYTETKKKNDEEILELQKRLSSASEYEAKGILYKIETLKKETSNKKAEYDKQNELVKGYYDDITSYEINSAKIQKGDMKSLMEVEQSVVTGKAKNNEEKKKLLQESLQAEKDYLKELEGKYKETNDEQYKSLIEGQKAKIKATEETIKGMTSTVEQNKTKNKTVWSSFSEQGLIAVKEYDPKNRLAGQSNADAYTKGVASKNPTAKSAGKSLAENDKQGKEETKAQHENAGKANADAYTKGVASKNPTAKNAGKDLAEKDKQGKQETKAQHESAGQLNAIAYLNGATSKSNESKITGASLAKQTKQGLLSLKVSVYEAGQSLGDNAIAGLNAKKTNMQASGKTIATSGVNGYKSMSSSFVKAGEESANGIKSGVDNKKSSLWSTMQSVGSSMLSSFKKSLKIQSPSRAFMEAGMFTVEGLALGIDENADMAIDSTQNMVNGMMRTIDGMEVEKAINTSLSLDGVSTNIVSSQASLADRINVLISLVGEYLPDIREKAGNALYIDGQLMSNALAGHMDIALGEIADFKTRGG